MGTSGISEAAERLVHQHIDSVEQLEVLLLLHRTAPRAWGAADVAHDLRIDQSSSKRRLEDLVSRGMVTRDGEGFSYRPSAHDASVRALSDAYRERRVAVITLIFTKPSDPVRELADAFRINKKGGS
ncbi:MAG: hypothetical protein ACJ790_02760 [Myxococcaceae bacterium]